MQIIKTFRYRLEPTNEQRRLFARFAGCCRFVFNYGLNARKVAFETEGKTLSYSDQCRALTLLKKTETTAWLGHAHSQILQQALKDLEAAYDHFFRGVKNGLPIGFPKFKRKGKCDSFRYPQDVKVEGRKVFLPKIGWVRFRQSRPPVGEIRQASIKREGQHWYISLTCKVSIPDPTTKAPNEAKVTGIDVGLNTFAVLSDGSTIPNPRFLRSSLAKLKKAQRELARKVKFSSNWKKQIRRIVQLHTKVKNCRKDFLHKVSTQLIKNHDVVVVEDLNVAGMVKNGHLSRAISDVGWGIFYAMLAYKAEWMGKSYIKIDRFLATSQTCSHCGTKKPMPLSLRIYECEECGMVLDRDLNASLNIRAAGLAVLGQSQMPVEEPCNSNSDEAGITLASAREKVKPRG